jgi:cell division transport system ATP-binding protein
MTTAFARPSNSTAHQQVTPNTSATQTSAMIQLREVFKTYPNDTQGLLGVTLEVKRGDFLFITGPSGAGKTTLLKLLYGAERPTSGEVIVDQLNAGQLRGDRLSLLRRRIGVVFQDYKLIPSRTVAENVAFVLWAQGFTRKEIERRLPPTLKLVGLQHKAKCFPDELSGGEQQRVSLARAIVSTPPIVLADEPTGNLDPDNSQQVLRILQKLNAIGATVIITTHDEQLVQMSNHRVVQLREGHLYTEF